MNPALEAEYADGYIHSEQTLNDISPYAEGRNIFYDIYEGHPEAEHGPLVRLTLFYNDRKYSIDWTKLPESARPIRFKHMRRERIMEKHPTDTEIMLVSEVLFVDWIDFGYKYNDETGKSIEQIRVIT